MEITKEFLEVFAGVLTAIVVAMIGYFQVVKRSKVDQSSKVLHIIREEQASFRTDLINRLDECNKRHEIEREKRMKMEEELSSLKIEFEKVKAETDKLKLEYDDLEQKYSELKIKAGYQ